MALSRRGFLAVSAASVWAGRVARAQGGLDQFGTAAPSCKPNTATPSVPADATYRAGSPLRRSFVSPGTPGTAFTLSGAVIGLSCGRIPGASVDFWQADAQGVYDRTGFAFRGHQVTDADGRYELDTVVPGATAGRAPHLGVHVRVADKRDLWTVLFFPDDPANRRDPAYRPELVMQPIAQRGTRAGVFDIILDL